MSAQPSGAVSESMLRTSRRRFLRGCGASLIGAGLGAPGALAGASLGYGCKPGYDDPGVLAALERATGTAVSVARLGDEGAALAALGSGDGKIDFYAGDAALIEAAAANGLARPLEGAPFDRIGHDLLPPLRPPFEPLLHDGLTVALPTRWGWTGPILGADADPAAWRDYAAAFDPKQAGRVGVMAAETAPLLILALHAGVNPFAPVDEAAAGELRRGYRAFFRNRPVPLAKRSDAAAALASGTLAAVIGPGSEFAAALRRRGILGCRALVAEPHDGVKQTLLWVEAVAVHSASTAPDAAGAALAALFEPAVGHALSLIEAAPAPSASAAVRALYSAGELALLQDEDADLAWRHGRLRRTVPDAAALQAIWDEARANAG